MRNNSLKSPLTDNIFQGRETHQELYLDIAGFEKLAQIILKLTGISLPNNEKNRTLMSGRVSPLLSRYGLKSYADLVHVLGTNQKGHQQIHEDLISCLTTNTTHFFRESVHFDFLKQFITNLMVKREFPRRPLRVWCSACSSGQEAYTLLFTLLSLGINADRQSLQFLATDIDLEILQKAANSVYTLDEVKGLPLEMKQKYFKTVKGGQQQTLYKVKLEYNQMIHFARFNLIQDRPAFKDQFDIIFCRNVLIYFKKEVSTAVIDMLISQLRSGGLIFLGHVETGLIKNKSVKPLSHAVYQKVDNE